jgi:uncharacterized protein (DUF2267 family)
LRTEGSARALYDEVARRSRLRRADAEAVTWATLVTLGERIPAREADELARHLPPPLDEALKEGGGHGKTFASDEFVARVASRGRFPERDARKGVAAVVGALHAALPAGELEYLVAVLPADYAWLFGGPPPPADPAVLATSG